MLIAEFERLYTAIKASDPIFLSSTQYTYANFVDWQTNNLASAKGEKLWPYWQQLAGELAVLNLPTDPPRPPMQTYHGASVHFCLTETLTQQLKALAQDGSLYMLLLASYQILLYRYTGQEDILVGSPTTGRTRLEFANIMGYFVNMVVLRSTVKNELTFKDFLEQVRQTVLEALDHQEYPFPLLVERLQPNRDSSRLPVFLVDFVFQKPQQFAEFADLLISGETEVRMNLGELELEAFNIQQVGLFDLGLEIVETQNSLMGSFKYNTDLFEPATMTRMVGHFQTLLEGIIANPLQPIQTLPLLTEADQQQLLIFDME